MSDTTLKMDVHTVSIEELCKRFNTNVVTGLNYPVSWENCQKYGVNMQTAPPTTPEGKKICKNVFEGPAMPLWLGAVGSFVASIQGLGVGNLFVGVSLPTLATVMGFYSYYQSAKSEKIIESMKRLVPLIWKPYCDRVGFQMVPLYSGVVRRDGERLVMYSKELTLGDIVEVGQGDIIPADIRILESNGLKVDNSSLTGESEPQKRSPNCTNKDPLQTENLAFCFTHVVEGSGVGMVVNIGDNTMMGRIAGVSDGASGPSTSLLSMMSGVSVSLGASLSYLAHLHHVNSNWLYPVIVCTGVLPMMMHAFLNSSITKVFYYCASYNCFVKDREAVKNLGSITCICSSKTGSMTQSRMTVCHLVFDNKKVYADTSEDPRDTSEIDKNEPSFKILERAAILCNSADFKPGQTSMPILQRQVNGNPTDGAVLKSTVLSTDIIMENNDKAVDNVMEYREKNKKVFEIPFISTNMFQLTIHETEDQNDGRFLVVMKGAPEKIMAKCNSIIMKGKETPLTHELKDSFEAAIEELAGNGERVIAFCDLFISEDEYLRFTFDDEENPLYCATAYLQDFRLVGLMSMIDPPRAAVPDSISKLKGMNMKMIMVTGDHPATARAIAISVGIGEIGEFPVVHGDQLTHLSKDQLGEILTNNKHVVFARVSPEQKVSIVQACQQIGHCTAMVGGGSNDTLAIKTANLGIAMGIRGSDAAKKLADMILLDDNYGSIVRALDAVKYTFRKHEKLLFFK